jgi:hypothetical protein
MLALRRAVATYRPIATVLALAVLALALEAGKRWC